MAKRPRFIEVNGYSEGSDHGPVHLNTAMIAELHPWDDPKQHEKRDYYTTIAMNYESDRDGQIVFYVEETLEDLLQLIRDAHCGK